MDPPTVHMTVGAQARHEAVVNLGMVLALLAILLPGCVYMLDAGKPPRDTWQADLKAQASARLDRIPADIADLPAIRDELQDLRQRLERMERKVGPAQ